MQNILSLSHREILKQFAWSQVLLAFDYDGTLAPIVPNPDKAVMRPETRELLWELTRLYRVIIISGRAQRDVMSKLRGTGVLEVVGNHGIEPWHKADQHAAVVHRWRPMLEACVGRLKGVTIEDKTYSLALHYRRSREKRKALAAILATANALDNARIIGGKQVVNLLPKNAPHKGVALDRERERLRCDTAIYVGDDETDEDVFSLDQPGRLLSIKVVAKRTSAAPFFLPSQSAIDDFLRLMIGFRTKAKGVVGGVR